MIDGVLLNPTRSALLDVLAAMGSRISMLRVEEQHGELVGTIALKPGAGRHLVIAGAQTALLIDELPVLAAIAPYTAAGIEVRDAGELRVKESDRLSCRYAQSASHGRGRSNRLRTAGAFPASKACTVLRSRVTTIIASPWRLPSPPCVPAETP